MLYRIIFLINNSFLGDKKGTRDKIWVNTHDDLYSTIKEAGGENTTPMCSDLASANQAGSIPNFRENSATLVKTKEINSECPTFNN